MTLTEAADPDALDRLAHHCDAAAQKIEDTYVPVRQAFHSSGWQGSDADQFATDWDGPSRARLTNTATALRDAATSLRRNANQQRAASDDTAGGGGGGPLGLSNELMRDLEEIIDGLGPGGLTGNQLVRDLEGLFGGGSILSNLADNQLIQLLGMTGGLLTLTRGLGAFGGVTGGIFNGLALAGDGIRDISDIEHGDWRNLKFDAASTGVDYAAFGVGILAAAGVVAPPVALAVGAGTAIADIGIDDWKHWNTISSTFSTAAHSDSPGLSLLDQAIHGSNGMDWQGRVTAGAAGLALEQFEAPVDIARAAIHNAPAIAHDAAQAADSVSHYAGSAWHAATSWL